MPNSLFFNIIAGGRKGVSLPAGGISLWFGADTTIPIGFNLYGIAASKLIMGAAAGAKNLIGAGAATHVHTVPTTSTSDSHTHSFSATSGGSPTKSGIYLQEIGDRAADSGHAHSLSATSSGKAGHAHTTSNTASADSRPPFVRLYYIKQTVVSSIIPVGTIIMLPIEPSVIGADWQLCNGLNGTPDLRGKFVYAASINSEIGVTGGLSSHGHTNPTVGAAGSHNHTLSGTSGTNTAEAYGGRAATYGAEWLARLSHAHAFSANSGTDTNHNHTLGSAVSKAVLPPYRNLYYVMKVT